MMTKKISLVFAVFLVSSMAFSQGKAPIGVGGKQLNFGIGLNNAGFPVYIGLDFGVHPDITIGGAITTNLNNFNYMGFFGKGDYHWNRLLGIPSNWDFYAGVQVGARAYFNNHNNDFKGFSFNVHVGGRWYWSNWGLNLEFGGGSGYGAQFGVSKKF